MKTFWIIASALGGVVAVVFVLMSDYDKAFIAAVLGCIAWFLNYRTGLREMYHKDETDEEDQLEEDQL